MVIRADFNLKLVLVLFRSRLFFLFLLREITLRTICITGVDFLANYVRLIFGFFFLFLFLLFLSVFLVLCIRHYSILIAFLFLFCCDAWLLLLVLVICWKSLIISKFNITFLIIISSGLFFIVYGL